MRKFLLTLVALAAFMVVASPAQASPWSAGKGPKFPLQEDPAGPNPGSGKWSCVRKSDLRIYCVQINKNRSDYGQAFYATENLATSKWDVAVPPAGAGGTATESGRIAFEKALNEGGVSQQIPQVNGASAGVSPAPGMAPSQAPGLGHGWADATTCYLSVRIDAPDNGDSVYDYHNVRVVWGDGSPDLYAEMGEGEVWDVGHYYPGSTSEILLYSSYIEDLDTGEYTSMAVVHPEAL